MDGPRQRAFGTCNPPLIAAHARRSPEQGNSTLVEVELLRRNRERRSIKAEEALMPSSRATGHLGRRPRASRREGGVEPIDNGVSGAPAFFALLQPRVNVSKSAMLFHGVHMGREPTQARVESALR
jgi:hypothetical protein